VTVQGFYRSQPEVNDAITKAAKEKGAYSFYIVRQVDANQGGNQRITAFIYKEDAKKRVLQSPDAIPADSDAGRAAIAKGGEEAKKVKFQALRPLQRQALKWVASLKRNPQRRSLLRYPARRDQN
jgi:hypothetical protein